jgi:hypothetical protein
MYKKLFQLLVIFLGFQINAFAYDAQISGYVKFVTVKANVKTQGLGVMLVGEPSLCGQNTPPTSYIHQEHILYDAVLSVALTSSVSQRKIQLTSNNVDGKCEIQQIRLDGANN